jgi:hypothetical protein
MGEFMAGDELAVPQKASGAVLQSVASAADYVVLFLLLMCLDHFRLQTQQFKGDYEAHREWSLPFRNARPVR